ncbi:unnamed protein product [Soboliphyme baturini]|uniref:HMA domain-containing protein n=1 Tax=Soboliphyme baturini TaxID=241478 RepID=A0A183I9F3_9BILA|nr:unnamed protein product [Soboliphyme baturini]
MFALSSKSSATVFRLHYKFDLCIVRFFVQIQPQPRLPAVVDVQVSVATHSATVKYDEDRCTASDIADVIRDIGYEADVLSQFGKLQAEL